MKETLRELTVDGFLIYPDGKGFVVERAKEPMIEPHVFETYDEAVDFAYSVYKRKNTNFIIVVRYNRGLGIEFKEIQCFDAKNADDARERASELIEECFKTLDEKYKIIGFKVKSVKLK